MNELEIIIPAYNSQDTIIITLDSIATQKNLPTYHVTIVNDCGNNYKQIVDYYKEKINIDEIKTPENIGPGGARQYGIDNTNSAYLVFIDSDDYFYDEYSVSNLYNKIKKSNADLVLSKFIYERDGEIKEIVHDNVWLHGKIYSRLFLQKNNIRFNNSRANEDNGFNNLIFLLKPGIALSNDITYVYKENPNSITRKNNREYKLSGLEGYAYNINWAIEEAEKRNAEIKDLAWKIMDGLLLMYESYNNLYNNPDIDNIILWSKELYKKYKKYKNIIKDIEKEMIETANIEKKKITFNEFTSLIEKIVK